MAVQPVLGAQWWIRIGGADEREWGMVVSIVLVVLVCLLDRMLDGTGTGTGTGRGFGFPGFLLILNVLPVVFVLGGPILEAYLCLWMGTGAGILVHRFY
jgi:hypothetical protein